MQSSSADPSYAVFFIDGTLALVQTLLPIVVTLALIVFFFGIVVFLSSAGDPKRRSEAKGYLVLGVITLFVMVSIWGIVEILDSIFGIDQDAQIDTPGVGGIQSF